MGRVKTKLKTENKNNLRRLHSGAGISVEQEREADKVLKPLAAGVFFLFFNGYMIAPLIPTLANEFQVSTQKMGLVIPAYLLTYGVATLIYGPVSDRIGRKKVLLFFLTLTILSTAVGALAWSADSLIAFRVLCGICAGGFLPISLALIGDLYPYEKLGRPLGWMFGAVAGGMSFGSTVGSMAKSNCRLANRTRWSCCLDGGCVHFAFQKKKLNWGYDHRSIRRSRSCKKLRRTLDKQTQQSALRIDFYERRIPIRYFFRGWDFILFRGTV